MFDLLLKSEQELAAKFELYLSFSRTWNADRNTAMGGPGANHTRTLASVLFWGGARRN